MGYRATPLTTMVAILCLVTTDGWNDPNMQHRHWPKDMTQGEIKSILCRESLERPIYVTYGTFNGKPYEEDESHLQCGFCEPPPFKKGMSLDFMKENHRTCYAACRQIRQAKGGRCRSNIIGSECLCYHGRRGLAERNFSSDGLNLSYP
ncbi:hypothetical protein HDE_01164 [Halotydeus destructor]|nr:hypothetical protein HDE_01164 [Halotydeus destructor]